MWKQCASWPKWLCRRTDHTEVIDGKQFLGRLRLSKGHCITLTWMAGIQEKYCFLRKKLCFGVTFPTNRCVELRRGSACLPWSEPEQQQHSQSWQQSAGRSGMIWYRMQSRSVEMLLECLHSQELSLTSPPPTLPFSLRGSLYAKWKSVITTEENWSPESGDGEELQLSSNIFFIGDAARISQLLTDKGWKTQADIQVWSKSLNSNMKLSKLVAHFNSNLSVRAGCCQ